MKDDAGRPEEVGDLEYDDDLIACSADAVVIRRYGPLLGQKTIPYADIQGVRELRLNALRRWRLWGTGDPRRWFNLDWGRRHKKVAFQIDVGGHVTPVITPDDPEGVATVLRSHGIAIVAENR